MAASPAFCADTYKIGGIFAVTGPAAFLGDPAKKSMELAVSAINEAGGIDGRKIEPVIYDTEGDPTKAVMGASKLINNDQVLAIIGPSTTPTTLAVVPLALKSRTPLVSCAAGNKITSPVSPWVFKTAQSDILAVASIYRHVKAAGITKVALLTVSNAYGQSGRDQLESQTAGFGLTVTASEQFGDKDTDMTAQITKIRKDEPQAIVCWGTNPGPAVVARNMQQLGVTIPLYQSHGVASPKFIELAGDAANGNILPTGKILVTALLPDGDPQKPVLAEYEKRYQAAYNQPVSGFGGYAYDAMTIVANALKGTGGDRQKLRDNIEKTTGLVGVTGTFTFTASEHNGLGDDAFVMVRIKDGKWELLP